MRKAITEFTQRNIRRISSYLPDLYILNLLVLSAQFYLVNGRFPTSLHKENADINDLIIWKSIGHWTDFEKSCVDKEESKAIARSLCPGIKTATTVRKIPVGGLSFAEFKRIVDGYRGLDLVVKPTHSSGSVIFLSEEFSESELRNLYEVARKSYFHPYRERQYHGLPKNIIIEETISGRVTKKTSLNDYKFFCSRGIVLLCQVSTNRYVDYRLANMSVPGFVDLGVEYRRKRPDRDLPRPPHWEQMIDYAGKLSEPFDFVRVDLYDAEDGVYFGEFTFTPSAGLTTFSDKKFGVAVLRRVQAIRNGLQLEPSTVPELLQIPA